jgi:hypothetical protein
MSEGPDPLMTEERLAALERFKAEMEQRFADAFPGGDHVGHCRYHALMIEGIEWRRRLWRAVMEKTIAGLVWGTMIAIGLACWKYFIGVIKGA